VRSLDSPSDILERLKQAAHWKVIVRPSAFDGQLIPELLQCWTVIEACRVSLRGWDYPHVDRSDRARGTDWIASWGDFGSHREYWRFFQTGQFIHLFSFREDAIPDALKRAISKLVEKLPPSAQPSGCADILELASNVTEIYELASRLAQRLALEGKVYISIELVGVKDRILTALDFFRAWWGYYPSVEDKLIKRGFSRRACE
jgi:hypothetical protein